MVLSYFHCNKTILIKSIAVHKKDLYVEGYEDYNGMYCKGKKGNHKIPKYQEISLISNFSYHEIY